MGVTVGEARRLVCALLHRVGLEHERAETTARVVVLAECWGLPSHGLMRVPYYLDRTVAGGYPAGAELRAVLDTGPVAVFDGGGGLGHWQVWSAAQLAAERSVEHGIAAVAVGNSGHAGALGTYMLPVLDRGQVGLVFSTGPAAMPAWNGSSAVLSTAPLAAGIPCSPRPAIVDMATSSVTRGSISARAARGERLPEGWAFDARGRPTTDASVALHGMLSPFGGAKGYALAFVVEALSAGLVGPLLAVDIPDMFLPEQASREQRIGHLVVAIDPAVLDSTGDPDAARARLDRFAALVVSTGGRVPGARRTRPEEVDDNELLPVASHVLQELNDWAVRLALSPDRCLGMEDPPSPTSQLREPS